MNMRLIVIGLRASRLMACAVIAAALFAETVRAEPKTLELSVAKNTVDTLTSEVILREAFNALGIDVIYNKRIAKRALDAANAGTMDGDAQRIDGLSEKFPNLIQVYPAINFILGTSFASSSDIQISGWESLADYRVGIIRGIKFAERGTEGMSTTKVSDYRTLFELVSSNRIDVAISPSLNGRYQLLIEGIEGVEEVQPPLERFDLYLYLHNKHADLVTKISDQLQSMADTGRLEAIRNHVVQVTLDRAAKGLPLCDRDYACYEPLPE